jgi:Co/Zn/Cd efflux system component
LSKEGHDHNHGGHFDPSKPVAYVNLSFSIIECIVGVLIGNAAVVASSAHDFVDGGGLFATFYLNRHWKGSTKHLTFCTLPKIAGIAIALLGPIASIIGLLIEGPNALTLPFLIAAITMAIGGIGINAWSLREMLKDPDKQEGYRSHFVQDIVGSIIVIVSSILAYALHQADVLIYGTYAIVVVTLALGTIAAIRDGKKIHLEGKHSLPKPLAAS